MPICGMTDLTHALAWALRLSYPALFVILWRRWLPGVAFGAYLVAATVAMWLYRPGEFWLAVLLTVLLYPLELLVTVELCAGLLFDTCAEVKAHISRALIAVVGIMTVLSWGIRYPHDAWAWLGFARTSVDSACVMMTAMVLAFVGLERLRTHWSAWVHAVIWMGYVAPQIVAGVLRQHMTEDDSGADLWDAVTAAVWMIRLACLGLWGWFGVRNVRR